MLDNNTRICTYGMWAMCISYKGSTRRLDSWGAGVITPSSPVSRKDSRNIPRYHRIVPSDILSVLRTYIPKPALHNCAFSITYLPGMLYSFLISPSYATNEHTRAALMPKKLNYADLYALFWKAHLCCLIMDMNVPSCSVILTYQCYKCYCALTLGSSKGVFNRVYGTKYAWVSGGCISVPEYEEDNQVWHPGAYWSMTKTNRFGTRVLGYWAWRKQTASVPGYWAYARAWRKQTGLVPRYPATYPSMTTTTRCGTQLSGYVPRACRQPGVAPRYPGAYPSKTKTNRFWYLGTRVHARAWRKQTGLVPRYPATYPSMAKTTRCGTQLSGYIPRAWRQPGVVPSCPDTYPEHD